MRNCWTRRMPTDHVALIGAGGHAKVVLDALRRAYPQAVVQVFDESIENVGRDLLGIPIQPMPQNWERVRAAAHVAIGDAAVRERIATALEKSRLQHRGLCANP